MDPSDHSSVANGAMDITYFNTQNSEYVPSSQHMHEVSNFIGQQEPSSGNSMGAKNEVRPMVGAEKPLRPRHKVEGRRCLVRRIKAPLTRSPLGASASPRLKSAPNAGSTNIPTVPTADAPVDSLEDALTVPQSEHYELISWFHEAQWRHARCKKTSEKTPASFADYLAETYNAEHFNIFLLGNSLEARNAEHDRLVETYHKISKEVGEKDNASLDKVLTQNGMSHTLYIKIGQMLRGEKPPFLTFSEAMTVDREARDTERNQLSARMVAPSTTVALATPDSSEMGTFVAAPPLDARVDSSNSDIDPAKDAQVETLSDVITRDELSKLSKTTVLKLLEIMKGIESRSHSRHERFEQKLKADEEACRRLLSTELERHDVAMRRIISGRIIDLHLQSLKRRQLRREDSTLSTELLELFEHPSYCNLPGAKM